jgi:hypothetical protein
MEPRGQGEQAALALLAENVFAGQDWQVPLKE